MRKEWQRNTVLFDLDGTLLDQRETLETVFRCQNYVQNYFGLAERGFEECMELLGADLASVMERFVGAGYVEEGCRIFKEHYDKLSAQEEVRLLDGSLWLLENLLKEGYKMAIFTNKPGDHAREIVKKVEIDHYFLKIIGRDDSPYCKPQGEFTRHVLKEMGVSAESALLIGDSIYDVEAGVAVDLPVYAVTTGRYSREDLLNHRVQAAGIFSNLYEVGRHLFGFCGEDGY